jgi:hypothetical protein
VPIVTGGWDSRGYKDFREVAPEMVVPAKSGGEIRDESDGYSTLLALSIPRTQMNGLHPPGIQTDPDPNLAPR